MNVKSSILSSTALALLLVSQPAQAEDFYVSVMGGFNWQSDAQLVAQGGLTNTSTWTSQFADIDPNSGYLISGAVGTSLDQWVNGLSAELEVAYRRNGIDGQWTQSSYFSDNLVDSVSGPIDGRISSFSILANVWYEFDAGLPVRPFLGGGLGWARTNAEGIFQSYTSFDETESGFAWQLGAGVSYDLKPGMKLGLDYRFFDGPSLHSLFDDFNAVANAPEINPTLDNQNHALAVSLKVDIF